MNEREIRDMRRRLDEQYKADRDTLDRMLDLISRSSGAKDAQPPESEPVKTLTIYERIASFVRASDTNFTMQEIWKQIKQKDPEFGNALKRQALSQTLWQMKKDGAIKIVIPKKGSSAAIYSKTQDFPA